MDEGSKVNGAEVLLREVVCRVKNIEILWEEPGQFGKLGGSEISMVSNITFTFQIRSTLPGRHWKVQV
jgi:hypothetical protein